MNLINLRALVIITLCLSVAFCAAFGRANHDKSRVIDNKLSDEDHFRDEDHNPDYDHEAFLGEEQAKEFDQMAPEESIEGLRKIADKIDKDFDGYVTQEELKSWIEYTQKKYIIDDVESQWSSHNPKGNDKISWEDYEKKTYGFMENMDAKDAENDEEASSYVEMKRRDNRRWEHADKDQDGSLDKEEFTDFLHPEESKRMRELVVMETMEDVDKDKDGKISPEEYIGDMYKGETEAIEPEWVTAEREQFNKYRDVDKSGFMERKEIEDWIMPEDYDQSDAEAKHLIAESDADGDGKLTKEEIVEKYDVFVGSQATDFGEAINRHDEF